MRQRYVLRYEGKGIAPEHDVKLISEFDDLQLVGQRPRMLLVEGEEEALKAAVQKLDNWIMTPESFVSHGDPRPKIEG